MRSQFTEHDTETFYDAEDALYRSFWDSEGSLHWGWFDDTTGDDFLKACANLNRIMAEKAGISSQSRVLDLGCGNGNTVAWLQTWVKDASSKGSSVADAFSKANKEEISEGSSLAAAMALLIRTPLKSTPVTRQPVLSQSQAAVFPFPQPRSRTRDWLLMPAFSAIMRLRLAQAFRKSSPVVSSNHPQ
jgi:SAM-dependent methyltransferase